MTRKQARNTVRRELLEPAEAERLRVVARRRGGFCEIVVVNPRGSRRRPEMLRVGRAGSWQRAVDQCRSGMRDLL